MESIPLCFIFTEKYEKCKKIYENVNFQCCQFFKFLGLENRIMLSTKHNMKYENVNFQCC